MNTADTIKGIRLDTQKAKVNATAKIAFIRKHADVINDLARMDWTWYVGGYSGFELSAEVLCDNEADIKNACRIARSICRCRSEKELNTYDGSMSYHHESSDGTIQLTVNGGVVTPGCELVQKVTYSEPYRQVSYEINCK